MYYQDSCRNQVPPRHHLSKLTVERFSRPLRVGTRIENQPTMHFDHRGQTNRNKVGANYVSNQAKLSRHVSERLSKFGLAADS